MHFPTGGAFFSRYACVTFVFPLSCKAGSFDTSPQTGVRLWMQRATGGEWRSPSYREEMNMSYNLNREVAPQMNCRTPSAAYYEGYERPRVVTLLIKLQTQRLYFFFDRPTESDGKSDGKLESRLYNAHAQFKTITELPSSSSSISLLLCWRHHRAFSWVHFFPPVK